MAGFLTMGEALYEGTLKLAGTDATVESGFFVTPDYSAGTVAIPADDATGEVLMVDAEIDTATGRLFVDKTFTYGEDDYVKALILANGKTVETTAVGSTYGDISVDDEVAVGADGKVYLVADLTAADLTGFLYTFTVTAKKKLWGTDALELRVKVK